MRKFQNKWIPDVNYNELEKAVLLLLCHKAAKLTGNEIHFIRLYFQMTCQAFAKRFGVQHPTVLKWEKFKDSSTNMTLGTEKDIRLFVIGHLIGQAKVGELYYELEETQIVSQIAPPFIELDIDKLAV